MTLIVDRSVPPARAAVHVLIVAAGAYPHLDGGNHENRFRFRSGLTQLTSPACSAFDFFHWVKSQYCPIDAELATVEVLCSGTQQFTSDAGDVVPTDSATLTNLNTAFRRWYVRANESPENILIFYFCGHGISTGEAHSLLMENFGDDEFDPFSTGAVDAECFVDGMRLCNAKRQLFLFDTCRSIADERFRGYSEHRGVALVSASRNANLKVSRQVTLWASERGWEAFGDVGETSSFMKSFLKAMKGPAARQGTRARWHVPSDALREGINVVLQREGGEDRQYVTMGDDGEGFNIHQLQSPPIVPGEVSYNPEEHYPEVSFDCSNGKSRGFGFLASWVLDLEAGLHTFIAKDRDQNTLSTVTANVSPPYANVWLNV